MLAKFVTLCTLAVLASAKPNEVKSLGGFGSDNQEEFGGFQLDEPHGGSKSGGSDVSVKGGLVQSGVDPKGYGLSSGGGGYGQPVQSSYDQGPVNSGYGHTQVIEPVPAYSGGYGGQPQVIAPAPHNSGGYGGQPQVDSGYGQTQVISPAPVHSGGYGGQPQVVAPGQGGGYGQPQVVAPGHGGGYGQPQVVAPAPGHGGGYGQPQASPGQGAYGPGSGPINFGGWSGSGSGGGHNGPRPAGGGYNGGVAKPHHSAPSGYNRPQQQSFGEWAQPGRPQGPVKEWDVQPVGGHSGGYGSQRPQHSGGYRRSVHVPSY